MDFDARWAYVQFVQAVARLPPAGTRPALRPSQRGPAAADRPVLVDPPADDDDDDGDDTADG
jgi:hypothetical protein